MWMLILSIVAVLFFGFLFFFTIRARQSFLKNKVVLITGGSRGLGLVIARQICGEYGKVAHDKRADLKKRAIDRETAREVERFNRRHG